jgi:hypothetical protein
MGTSANDGEPTFARFIPGSALSPALAAMVKQCDGVFWMLTAIASWVTCGANDNGPEMFDENGMNLGEYVRLLRRWPCLRDSMQMFELRRNGQAGAELCIAGGADLEQDDSLSFYAIQRWSYAQIPWTDAKPFRVWAARQITQSGRDVWLLMLPSEY